MHDDEDDTPYQGPKAATRGIPGDYDDEESGSEEYDEEEYNDMANRYGASAQRFKERKDLSQRISFVLMVLALLCETYYDYTKQICEKEKIFEIIAPIMIDSEEYERDKVFRKRLLLGASNLFASITASKNEDSNKTMQINSVVKSLARETGLVATFCLNLVSLKDEEILKNIFQIIGNLACMKEVQ